MQPETSLQLVVFGCGAVGVGLSYWRASVGVKNEIKNLHGWVGRLTKAVEKLNGKTESVIERQHALERHCAGQHGKDPMGGID